MRLQVNNHVSKLSFQVNYYEKDRPISCTGWNNPSAYSNSDSDNVLNAFKISSAMSILSSGGAGNGSMISTGHVDIDRFFETNSISHSRNRLPIPHRI